MEPYERMGQYGAGVTGLISGYPGQYQTSTMPNPTPLQTALGTGAVLGGIYGNIRNPGTNVGNQNSAYNQLQNAWGAGQSWMDMPGNLP